MSTAKQQLNVTLPPDLIRAAKHQAIDSQLSLSDWLETVLTTHLLKGEPMPNQHGVTVQPMVHVTDMAASVSFYEALGGSVINGSRDGDFVLLSFGTSQLALLAHPANPEQNEGEVELNFEANNLDQIQQSVQDAGVEVVAPVSDEGFGRQLQLRAPGGLLIKINELDPTLYGPHPPAA